MVIEGFGEPNHPILGPDDSHMSETLNPKPYRRLQGPKIRDLGLRTFFNPKHQNHPKTSYSRVFGPKFPYESLDA